ncbi:MAG TPA: alkaline phosphatase family protein [Candidatus Dormibacteraeota bacterium]
MPGIPVRVLGAATAVGIAASVAAAAPVAAKDRAPISHVLLLSIDGLHQTDLEWYVAHHPASALASLVAGGIQFTHAQTPVPSDSFPGMVGQVTGGNPSSTGIWYDDSFNAALLPPGTTGAACQTTPPGTEVTYFEALAFDQTALDSGAGLPGLPDGILALTGNATSLINPANLPVDPNTCKPVYPHQYLRVNTVFEVARAAGLRTAWSDKHAAYEVLNGPSGKGVMDLFTPEINSDAPTPPDAGKPTGDWTSDNLLTQRYDSYKVQAVLNEIDGFDHGRTQRVGVPAIFGMNFQTVSTAQKLTNSPQCSPPGSGCGNPKGGYLADGVTPGPVLTGALDYINAKVGKLLAEINAQGLRGSTAVILSAKHGQSPDTPAALTRIDDGPIIDALNAQWAHDFPSFKGDLVAFAIDDDGWLMWLNDRSQFAADYAKRFLLGFSGTGNNISGQPKPFVSSGLREIFAGEDAADYFHTSVSDPRTPQVFGIAQYGTVYTGGKKKIAEHGGANPQDRDVPLVISGSWLQGDHVVSRETVETTQIAPTILRLLGLDPHALQAVQIEHTPTLPID